MDQQTESNVVEQKVQEQTNQESQISSTSSQSEESSPKSSQDWHKFREARAQERKRAEEIQRQAEKSAAEAAALKAALEAMVNKPSHQSNSYEDSEETEEQRIDRRVSEALARRDAEYEKQRRQQEQQEYPQKLQSTFSDFNQVCTTENLDYLEYHYPEVAEAFKHAPDGYNKWASVYKAVKRFVPNIDGRKEMKRAEANLAKPQSISSAQGSTSGQGVGATRLDESRKRANWERMQRQMKGIN